MSHYRELKQNCGCPSAFYTQGKYFCAGHDDNHGWVEPISYEHLLCHCEITTYEWGHIHVKCTKHMEHDRQKQKEDPTLQMLNKIFKFTKKELQQVKQYERINYERRYLDQARKELKYDLKNLQIDHDKIFNKSAPKK